MYNYFKTANECVKIDFEKHEYKVVSIGEAEVLILKGCYYVDKNNCLWQIWTDRWNQLEGHVCVGKFSAGTIVDFLVNHSSVLALYIDGTIEMVKLEYDRQNRSHFMKIDQKFLLATEVQKLCFVQSLYVERKDLLYCIDKKDSIVVFELCNLSGRNMLYQLQMFAENFKISHLKIYGVSGYYIYIADKSGNIWTLDFSLNLSSMRDNCFLSIMDSEVTNPEQAISILPEVSVETKTSGTNNYTFISLKSLDGKGRTRHKISLRKWNLQENFSRPIKQIYLRNVSFLLILSDEEKIYSLHQELGKLITTEIKFGIDPVVLNTFLLEDNWDEDDTLYFKTYLIAKDVDNVETIQLRGEYMGQLPITFKIEGGDQAPFPAAYLFSHESKHNRRFMTTKSSKWS